MSVPVVASILPGRRERFTAVAPETLDGYCGARRLNMRIRVPVLVDGETGDHGPFALPNPLAGLDAAPVSPVLRTLPDRVPGVHG